MRSHRWVSLAMASAVIAALGSQGLAAAESTPPTDYTQVSGLSQPIYDTFRESFTVPMGDDVEIYVEVERPTAEGRFPVIMEASPYHGTLHARTGTRVFPDPREGGTQLGLSGYFAPRGYAVAMVDLRGTGRSGGCLDHLGNNDADDLKAVIEWAAQQPWSNGRVGMTGHSYVAASQIVAAAQKPKGLVTIVPSAGLASMYDHQFQMGVPYYLQWAGPQWAYELLAIDRHLPPGTSDPVQGGSTGDNFGNGMEYFGCGMQNSALLAGSGQVTGQYEDWHAARDWREAAAKADIPIFMVHGVNDNAARIPAAEWFFKDRAELRNKKDKKSPTDKVKGNGPPDHANAGGNGGRPVNAEDKVWLGQWDHGGSAGSCAGNRGPHPNCRFAQWQFALHAWFDKHLQQRDIDTGPNVEVFLNDGWVYTDERWAPAATPLRLYADADQGGLAQAAPAEEATTSFVAAPTWSTTGPTYVDFTSAPVEERTVIIGVPRLDLSAATTGPVQLVASVYEKSGTSIDLNHPVTVCAIQPLLREGIDTIAPIVPAARMDMEPQCFTAAHVLEPGDQLVLRISAAHRSTGSHHAPTLGGDPQVTIFTDGDGTAVNLPQVIGAELHPDPAT